MPRKPAPSIEQLVKRVFDHALRRGDEGGSSEYSSEHYERALIAALSRMTANQRRDFDADLDHLEDYSDAGL